MSNKTPSFLPENDETYQNLISAIRADIARPLSDAEADEAARNLLGFFATLLAIRKRMIQDKGHEQHD